MLRGEKKHKLIPQSRSLRGVDSNLQHLTVPYHRQKGVSKIFWTDIALMHSLTWKVQRNVVAHFKWFESSRVVCNTWFFLEIHLWNVRWYCWWYQAFSQCVELERPAQLTQRWKLFRSVCLFLPYRVCFTSSKGLTKQQRWVNIWPRYFWESWCLCQLCSSSLVECRAGDGRCKDCSWTQAEGFPQRVKPLQEKVVYAVLASWESAE